MTLTNQDVEAKSNGKSNVNTEHNFLLLTSKTSRGNTDFVLAKYISYVCAIIKLLPECGQVWSNTIFVSSKHV